jgi:hypothetical protein
MMNSSLRLLFALSIYLISGPTLAEPLLVEFSDEMSNFGSASVEVDVRPGQVSVGQSLKHSFQIGQMPANGTTFAADDQMVIAMGACLVTSNCQLAFVTGAGSGGTFDILPDGFWTWINRPGYTQKISTFVPQLGPGITGYRLTSISQTLDNARLTFNPGGYYFGSIKQTVRFYGIAVPEPATIAIALFYCAMWSGVRFRR